MTPLLKPIPDKGGRGGTCNRRTCALPEAWWFNPMTQGWYCKECARSINNAAQKPVCRFVDDF